MKHNTPCITLQEFIAAKPKELRLGQWFVNTYWKGSDARSQQLYQLDGYAAMLYIKGLMEVWQWEALPDIK